MRRWLAILILLLWPPAHAGAPDLREAAARQALGVALRWDNVEETSGRAGAVAPRLDLAARLHRLHLAPGEWTEVLLPPGAGLRVQPGDARPLPGALRFEISTDGDLYARRAARPLPDGGLLLESDPLSPTLARVQLDEGAEEAASLALFVSRAVTAGPVVQYAGRVDTGTVWVRRTGETGKQRFRRLAAGERLELELQGPARLRLQQYLPFEDGSGGPRHYRLHHRLDGGPLKTIDASASAARRHLLLVDGEPLLASEPRDDYLDLPPGRHRLQLWFSEGLLLRLLATRPDDNLLPEQNAPDIPTLPEDPLFGLYREGLRTVGDNRRPAGGLVGAMTLLESARDRTDLPALQGAARELLYRHTYYDNLPPRTAGVRKIRVAPRRLRLPQDGTGHFLLATGERGALAEAVPTAWFAELTAGKPLDYPLPPRPVAGLLRLLVLDAPAGARLRLRFDDRPPVELRIGETPGDLPHVLDGAAALASQARDTARDAPWQVSVRQIRPARAIELPLPRDVQKIRLERTDRDPRPLSVALQRRAAQVWRLSDASYLGLLGVLRAEGVLRPLWQSCLRHTDTALDPEAPLPEALLPDTALSETARAAARAVVNHWVPLLRWLRARGETYRAAIARDAAPRRRTVGWNEAAAAAARARALEGDGQWVAALEQWRLLADSREAHHRRAALDGSLRALSHLGEYRLAERLLRQAFLEDTPDELLDLRLQKAEALYRRTGDHTAWQGLLANALARTPTAELTARLVKALLEAGRGREALAVAWLLPERLRPTERLLAEAVRLRAWPQFDALLAGLDDDRRRALWLGHRAWRRDAPDEARRHWRQAGEEGAALLSAADTAERLAAALRRSGDIPRDLAARRLAEWLQTLPGPRAWRPADGLAESSAGMAWLYSPALDLGFEALRATPERPLRLKIAGPARLRLDIRPLHPAGAEQPVTGWLRVDDGEQQWISPFGPNRPSTALQWPGASGQPGGLVRRELNLGEGIHELNIAGVEHELLVRLYLEAPVLDLGLSPAAALPPAPDWAELARGVACTGGDVLLCEPANTAAAPAPSAAGDPTWLATPLPATPPANAERPPAETPLVAGTGGAAEADAYGRLVRLLWRSERQGADPATFLAHAEALAAEALAGPHAARIRPLMLRLGRGARWQPLDYVAESAGIRYLERPAGEAEAPALRVRAALLPARCRGLRLLGGREELVYALFNLRPATLGIRLEPCAPPWERAQPLQATVMMNDRPAARILLQGEGQRLRLRTGRGRQDIRLRLDTPVVNHYLGVHIEDPAAPDTDRVERAYQIATPDEPLRLEIEGPAWLRVDELRDGITRSRYLAVAPGWQTLELAPEAGREEALLRLFIRTTGPAPTPARPAPPLPAPTPAPAAAELAALHHPWTPPADDLRLGGQEDGTPSLGLRLVSRTRVDDEEEGRLERFREEFAELRGEYRFFDEAAKRYWRSELLARRRADGGPVLGFGQYLHAWPLRHWPRLQTSAQVRGFMQRPGNARPGRDGGTEWSLAASLRTLLHVALGPRTYHEPSLTLFGRALSLDRNDRYPAAGLDRDVFSRYKAQHRRGLRLADYLVHKPWRDTEWYGLAAVTSNEDFLPLAPDNLEGRLGWRQLLGDIDLDAGYRLRHYLPDNDRDGSSTRHDLRLQLKWMRWNLRQQRAELRLFVTHDLGNGDSSVYLGLFLHGGNGRGLRDFRSNEVRFPDLRGLRMPRDANRIPAP